MVHGPSCSTYQTAINVQRRFSVALLNAVPVPIHPVSTRYPGNEGSCGKTATAIGAEGDVFRIPDVWMPTLSAYLAPQFRTGQAPVTQHNHAHFPGDRRGQGLQQFHYRVHLSPALVGALDWPYTQQVFKLERSFEYVKEGKTTFDAVYGITSLGFPPSFSAVKRRSFGLYTISGVMGTKPAPSPRRRGASLRAWLCGPRPAGTTVPPRPHSRPALSPDSLYLPKGPRCPSWWTCRICSA